MEFHRNKYKKLNNSYVSLRQIKGKYCLDEDDLYFPTIINDTSIVFCSMDYPDLVSFEEPYTENDKYVIKLGYNYGDLDKIEIKIIDRDLGIQVWHYIRESKYTNSCNDFYRLNIPVVNIKYIPILYTKFSLGVEYSNFSYDDINLKELFNK